MEILVQVIMTIALFVGMVARTTLTKGLSIDWATSVRTRTLVISVAADAVHPTVALLQQCGGAFITPYGSYLPVIYVLEGYMCDAFLWHEVGHKPDLMAEMGKYSLRLRLLTAVTATLVDQLDQPKWVVKFGQLLTKLFKVPAQEPKIVVDADFEIRADAYAVLHVGAAVLRAALVENLIRQLGVQNEAEMHAFLNARLDNPAVASIVQRFNALDALL